jgi:outer membrane lipoprotein carrier protein
VRRCNFIPTIALSAISALFPLSVYSSDDSSAIDDLDALLSGIKTLSAEVLQLIVESDGGVLEESTIKMQLKKPNGFYWETLEPFPELIVTNGIKLWNYQPDLEQVVVEDWETDQSELAAQLLSGRTDNLQEEYSITAEETSSADFSQFKLTPLASDNVYSSIAIRFSQSKLESITMDSKNGERTVWNFADVTINAFIDDEVFTFDAPAGIEVIENGYSQ